MKSFFARQNILFLAIPLFLLIAAIFIYRSNFIIGNTTYYSLIDDQMISMRYAHNLAQGFGLVWNSSGERVEGITNLLWTVYMSLWHLLPIPAEKISLFIQISCVFFLALNLYFTKKLADLIFEKSWFISTLSTLSTALYLPLLKWGIYGTEVSILTLFTTVSVYLACLSVKTKKLSIPLFILLGTGILIRLDFFTIVLVILVFLYIKLQNKKKDFFIGLLIVSFFLVAQTLFRISYFGEILPNTYYLKMTGYPLLLRITNGIYNTFLFIIEMNWILFFIPLFTLLRTNKYLPLLFGVIIIQLFYNIYVGGDMGDLVDTGSNRFLSIAMPIFFILFSSGVRNIIQIFAKYIIIQNRIMVNILTFILFVISMANFNVVFNEVTVNYFLAHRKLGTVPGNKFNTQKALIIDAITEKNAKIAVFWAGTTPYFSQRTYIDLLGKSDKVIAHEKAQISDMPNGIKKFIFFNPGHTKWDYDYSISHLLPDIAETIAPSSKGKYVLVAFGQHKHFYLLKNSPNIKWGEIKKIQANKELSE